MMSLFTLLRDFKKIFRNSKKFSEKYEYDSSKYRKDKREKRDTRDVRKMSQSFRRYKCQSF